jgi:outer membrane lipoprotein SlyB
MLDSLGGFVPGSATDNTERNLRKRFVWRVTLRMDDGSFRAISLSAPPAFAVGEKVRVVEGHLVRA